MDARGAAQDADGSRRASNTGCASAASAGSFDLLPAVLCLLFAFLMQIDANLINDLWDYLKGSDGKDRLGPERPARRAGSRPAPCVAESP